MSIDWKNITLEELAALVSEEFKSRGVDIILVGGACVTIYSENRYQSYALDFVTYENKRIVKQILKKLGFEEVEKYFRHPECPWIIEFVSPPVAVGDEPIRAFSYTKTSFGTVKMLTPTDAVKDRLASFFHWGDRQALEQAKRICEARQDIDYKELKKWAEHEGCLAQYEKILNRAKNREVGE